MQIQTKRVETRDELEACLDNGLAKLYKDVFAEPPWQEDFPLDEVKESFRRWLAGGGTIFVATDKDKPVAFVVSVPLTSLFNAIRETGEAYAATNGVDIKSAAYFAEDGVAADYRGQGLSGRLKRLLLEANEKAGLKAVLLRTGEDSYAQISAVNKAGGTVLSGIFQDVASKRTDGNVRTDRRVYYVFDAETKAAGMDVVERAQVLRLPDEGDRVVISSPVAPPLRKDLADRIKAIYPAVKSVQFAPDEQQGNVIFSGRMYVAKTLKYAA